jgi:hypothetical protein
MVKGRNGRIEFGDGVAELLGDGWLLSGRVTSLGDVAGKAACAPSFEFVVDRPLYRS